MTLKSSSEKKKPASNLLGRRFGDFKEGEVVFGIIKRIEKFGMFVTIEQSSAVSLSFPICKFNSFGSLARFASFRR